MNLAIVSPSQKAYSETFIQQHKNIPGVNVKYYYGGLIPGFLEGNGELVSLSLFDRVKRQLRLKFKYPEFTWAEDGFYKSLKKQRIDCVLAEYGLTGACVMKVCRKLNIPLVIHFHGYDASKNEIIEQYKDSYAEMFEYASAVIVVSKVMENKILSLGCPAEKVVYNTYGPDPIFYSVETIGSSKNLISVGRFVDKKAPYYTLLAFKKILDFHPDAKLILAGDGILLSACKNLVRYFSLDENVEFPGIITQREFINYLKTARAYVQHSITAQSGDMEGTPVSILEASAAGLPVISTLHAGIPDVIIHGKTGLLCEEHNVDEMAANMKAILDDQSYAAKLGSEGKKNINNNFSLDKHLWILSKVVKNTVKNHKSN